MNIYKNNFAVSLPTAGGASQRFKGVLQTLQQAAIGTLLLATLAAAPAQAAAPDLRGLAAVPLNVAPALEAPRRVARPRKGQPLEFARSLSLPLALAQGRWDLMDDGRWRWRTRVHSSGALWLGLEFSEFRMPEGGELWVYDSAGRVAQGPYTHLNETPEGLLATALVPGDRVIVEARLPPGARDALRLRLSRVQHADTDVFKTGMFGTAGSCNIDVSCSQGSGWSNEARSTLLLISGTRACSGVLVNNVLQDNTPYVLTANHCGIRNSGANPASGVVVYWLYHASGCNSGDFDATRSQSGSTFISRSASADYTLLRLNAAPAAASNVYFAGWDVSGAGASSGVGLHHPSGDVKKISLFTQALTRTTLVVTEGTVQVWQLDHWDAGVTEQGSSGSGLWNQDRHLVGVLSGGRSQCTVDNSDPANPLGPSQPDFYGRLDVAWTNGLKATLDPGNSGVTVLCGRNPADAACSATVVVPPVPAAAAAGGGGSLPGSLLLMLLAAFSARRASRAATGAPAAASSRRHRDRSSPSG